MLIISSPTCHCPILWKGLFPSLNCLILWHKPLILIFQWDHFITIHSESIFSTLHRSPWNNSHLEYLWEHRHMNPLSSVLMVLSVLNWCLASCFKHNWYKWFRTKILSLCLSYESLKKSVIVSNSRHSLITIKMEDNKIKFSSFQVALLGENQWRAGGGDMSVNIYLIWPALLGKFIIKLIKHC